MASRDVALLHPKMQELVKAWLVRCPVDVLIYCTVREAFEQATLYAKGRVVDQLTAGVARLTALGLDAESKALAQVAPALGPRVTNALPGLSFHQPHWYQGVFAGLALDFVPIVAGKPQWNDSAAYQAAAEAAEGVGLTWAGRWTTFKETAHLQWDEGGKIEIIPLAQGAYK